MKNRNVLDRLEDGRVLFDGAMGTMLIARGLSLGRSPEQWNLDHPDVVRDIHAAYLSAGAEVIGTNTFGACPCRLSSFGLGADTGKLNTAAVRLAREAIAEAAARSPRVEHAVPPPGGTPLSGPFVAFSVGPTGKMLPPVGKASPEEIAQEFDGQFADTRAPYDLVLIETMFDLREALIAVASARRNASVPVAATLTFAKNPRGFFTIMGDDPARTVRELEAAGADVVGANCTIASAEMLTLARVLRVNTNLPLLCQPNAGQPRITKGLPVYDQTPQDFASDALALFAAGVNAVGGCCGTTPRFIEEVRARMSIH